MRNSLILALISMALPAVGLAAAPAEYDLKAAYLFNVLKFVEWPALANPGKELIVGLSGAEALQRPLEVLAAAELKGRKLLVRKVHAEADLRECHVVFFGRSNGQSGKLVALANSAGVLTVGNDSGFASVGGTIALITEGRKILVEVNNASVVRTATRVSSHLLEIARVYKGAQ